MSWKNKKTWLSAMLAVWLTACSGENAATDKIDKPENAPEKPVTLTLYNAGTSIGLEEMIEKLVKEKFPHITINTIKRGEGINIQVLLSQGTIPDLISNPIGGVWGLKDDRLLSDLTPLIKKYGFDLGRLTPGIVENVKAHDDNGEFIFMPFELNNNALFYNKNIFDKFGVAYPTDNMTWEQVYELAKKVTRMENGIQYKGFLYDETSLVHKNQLGQAYVDPKTQKAAVNNDQWKKWLEVMTSFYQIEGNQLGKGETEKDLFLKSQTLAMRTGPNFLTELPEAEKRGMGWDVVSLPHFSGGSGQGSQMNTPIYGIPSISKYREEAFQVIAYLLSDEVQSIMARQGRIPVLKNEQVLKEFGAGLEGLKGKNLTAFFKDTIAKPISLSRYDGISKVAIVSKGIRGVGMEKKDLNTALREVEEEINKGIEAALNK